MRESSGLCDTNILRFGSFPFIFVAISLLQQAGMAQVLKRENYNMSRLFTKLQLTDLKCHEAKYHWRKDKSALKATRADVTQ